MNLGEIIEFVDGVKPNDFQPEAKVVWLNELERLIQTDVLMRTEGFTDHVWSHEWKGAGVTFPDDATMVIPGTLKARPGGRVDIEDLEDYAGNNGAGVTVLTSSTADGVTTVTFASGSFSAVGTEPETGTAKIYYDGMTETMVAPEIWEKIYYSYLEARIAAANGEWNEYGNLLQLYNAFITEYTRWVARQNDAENE